jgi:hypothetical protein
MSQEWSLTPQVQQPRRRGRGLLWSGVVLLVLALVLGLAGAVGIGRGVGSLVSGTNEPVATPASFSADLEGGSSYTVYEAPPFGSVPTIGPDAVSVVGTDGTVVPVTGTGSTTESFVNGETTFVAVAQFVAPATGTYLVQVPTPGTTVVLGPSFSELVGLGIWGLLIGLAVLLGLVGLILLVIGLVLRASTPKPAYGGATYLGTPQAVDDPFASQSHPTAAASPAPTVQPAQPDQPALPPAGWYPDPSRPGGQRYWNGERWTEHQA